MIVKVAKMSDAIAAAKRIYSGAALMVLNVIVILAILNLLALLILFVLDASSPRVNVVSEKYGESQALLYPNLTPEEVDQLLTETWGRRKLFRPYTMFREAPFKGKFVNVHEAGFRISRNQGIWPPIKDKFNLFLFGGSTAFSYGLPDDQSLGSYMQPIMTKALGRQVNVYNFAVGGFQSTQEKVLFQEMLIDGIVPDMAIFIDGINEFAFPVEPMGTKEVRRLIDDTPARRFIWLSAAVVERLPVIQLIRRMTVRRSSAQATGLSHAYGDELGGATNKMLDAVVARYTSNRKQIEAVANRYGVTPVFVWQPVPYYNYDRRLHPFSSEANRYVERGYARMREALPANPGINFLWCADMQKDIKKRLYLDAAHYTAEMSELLANEIVRALVARELMSDETE